MVAILDLVVCDQQGHHNSLSGVSPRWFAHPRGRYRRLCRNSRLRANRRLGRAGPNTLAPNGWRAFTVLSDSERYNPRHDTSRGGHQMTRARHLTLPLCATILALTAGVAGA